MKLFVTGTDTGVGKTLIACGLLLEAARRGARTLGVKPVAAGVDADGRNADACRLRECASIELPYEQINPVLLEEPLAPHIAAARRGRRLEAAVIVKSLGPALAAGADVLIMEGAGGWRVPLNERQSMAEIPKILDMPALLVVDLRLGCLNHAVLSAEVIAADGVPLAGWVGTSAAPVEMSAREENVRDLHRRLPAPCWGIVPPLSDPSPERVAEHLRVGVEAELIGN